MYGNQYPVLTHKKFKNLIHWKFDKITLEWNEVRKIEVYNYINRDDVQKIIKFFNRKSFHRSSDTTKFHSIFNIILHHEWKHTHKNEVLWDIQGQKYYYFVDFAKVLCHRGSYFLVKIYRNKSQDKAFSKIEITYWRKKNKYNLFYADWASKLKGMAEIINSIESQFDFLGYVEDFSGKQDIYETIVSILDMYDSKKKEKFMKILA
jgi:hypothetical protein